MYTCMKILISKQFYKTAEDVQTKLDTFYALNRLSNEEYTELTALVTTTYTDVATA